MNDLADLQWDAGSSKPQNTLAPNAPNYSSLRPTSPNISRQSTPNSGAQSGRSTPLSALNAANKPSAGTNSFANLLPTTKKSTAQLSMQERQKQLIEERARQAAEQQKRHNDQFRVDDNRFWEDFGKSSGTSTPALNDQPSSRNQTRSTNDDEDDILAAFNATAPVDFSSHFPPPSRMDALNDKMSNPGPLASQKDQAQALPLNDDDDPFGLGQMPEFRNEQPRSSQSRLDRPLAASEDDDILGDLGKPVSEATPSPGRSPAPTEQPAVLNQNSNGPRDRAIAELVDMGFSIEKSRDALDHTSTGMDVQAAVGWLLNQAHEDSRSKSQNEPRRPARAEQLPREVLADDRNGYLSQKTPTNRNDSRSPSSIDKEVAQRASDIGSSLFKSANSFWRQGQKRMQKAMAEFQQGGDPNQPRWLQESHQPGSNDHTSSTGKGDGSASMRATDEAMMLDIQKPAAPSRPSRSGLDKTQGGQSGHSSVPPQPRRQNTPSSPQTQELPSRPASGRPEKLNRRLVEEETAQAYVSPARRRRPPPPQTQPQSEPRPSPPLRESKPTPSPDPTTELDIFSSNPPASSQAHPTKNGNPPQALGLKHAPLSQKRASAPARSIPQVSPASLSQSNKHRVDGTAAFKRGDYSSAHASYTSAIAPLPATHPIIAILHSNRALTSIKTGDPKAAISDADIALNLIGPSRGEGETISLGEGEPDKPMKEFYGKALMRKAEAHEHLEKWSDAAKAWREAVEAGVGGTISIQGRNRCEKAAGLAPSSSASTSGRPSPAPLSSGSARKPPPAKPKPRSAAVDIAGSKESDAVTRLRAANAAAAAASDEAFALSDSVQARLDAWKDGKEGNLRGLLASLDTVLWEGAGWTKVGMGDLVMPNRCKVVYMKAIAKCHPDKIPSDASTEQRMISASVFATLNEAWDRFKTDNGL